MGSPNVVKIYIALEELGLPYTVAPVDVFTGKPCTLFESGAILLYLAEKTGKLLPFDIATYPWARNIPVPLRAEAAAKFANVMRWVAIIDARPAVKKALAEGDAVRARTTRFDKAAAQDLDKLFGRGQFAAA